MRRALVALAGCALAVLVAAPGADASRRLKLGITDDARVFGESDNAFSQLTVLKPQVLRVNLWWKDVATNQPARGTGADPDAPAANGGVPTYDWSAYDAVALRAKENRISLMFTILGTPSWANGGRHWRYPPKRMGTLRAFATAAATRYGGSWVIDTGETLPRVKMWTAWNEPNLSYWLRPFSWSRRTGYTRAIGRVYARVCNAIVRGVHDGQPARGEKVACGVTSPRKWSRSASVTPLDFLGAIKRAGARFDVYAHHPHPTWHARLPSSRPPTNDIIVLGNIDVLQRKLRVLYGRRMRLWLSEYGYQTKPPDPFGTSPRNQSRYLRQTYAIAKRNRKIDVLIWFLLRDEAEIARWQSGLMFDQSVRAGRRKAAFYRFRCLAIRRAASLC